MDVHYSHPFAIIDPNNLCRTIQPIDICGKFVLRNVDTGEMEFLAELRNNWVPSAFRNLPPLTPKHCLLEITENVPSENILNIVMRVLTFLRLSSPGCLGVLIIWRKRGEHPLEIETVDTSRVLIATGWPGYENNYSL